MLNLFVIGAIGVVIGLGFLIIIRNNPDLWFWLFLNLYFDPGGYIDGFLGGKFIGPINLSDVMIAGMFICLISANFSYEVLFRDNFFRKFLFFLSIYAAYYFIVYGGITPYIHDDFDYTTFLLKNRTFIYSLLIMVSVYMFTLRGLKLFYLTTLFIGLVCLSLYLITLLTGIELIYVWELQREGTEMTRIAMISYGLFYMLFPISLIVYLLSRKFDLKIPFKYWLYSAGIMFILTEILTLTRRTQIDIIGAAIIISLLTAYLLSTGKLSSILKPVLPAIVAVLVLYFTFPDYVGYMTKTAENTFLLITTGKDSEGQSDYRVSGDQDLELTKKYIRDNIFFGTGYTYLHWGGTSIAVSPRGATFAAAADAAGEVPVYNLIFGFGLVGAAIMLPLYFLMGGLFFKLIRLLKSMLPDYLNDPYLIIFSLYFSLTVISWFTMNFYNLSIHFTGSRISITAVFIGIGFALYRKINLDIIIKSLNNN